MRSHTGSTQKGSDHHEGVFALKKGIRRALEVVPGVRRAEVSYASGGAAVEVEPGRVTGEQLVQAVAHAGNILSSYRATVVPNGTLTADKRNESDILNWFRKLLH